MYIFLHHNTNTKRSIALYLLYSTGHVEVSLLLVSQPGPTLEHRAPLAKLVGGFCISLSPGQAWPSPAMLCFLDWKGPKTASQVLYWLEILGFEVGLLGEVRWEL